MFLIHLTVTAVTVRGMLTFLFFSLFHSTVTLCLQVSVLIIIPSLTSQPSDLYLSNAAATAKSLQSCLTLSDPIVSSPPGSPIPGILQARTLEWGAISFSNAWKWSHSVMSNPQRPHGLQPSRLLHPRLLQARVLEWGAIAFSKEISQNILKKN